ncbi:MULTISPECIES: DUF6311 domain-containing protein [unclassified Pseudomonas]|jgi:hypothetical protein|uniref:DUF6311 domain-containing protein n=1 Tax=unclassified Pseudomonas TaxID=196821 RepID=UPI002A3616EB|nr:MULTISPECIES: DUF6311 domain-containing protein [unclassified Pseudomonas]MDX9670474.1 DUF6311 domain-containing protein [Pseudomonas sp. P8_250]WPN35524.1 DUF6311 domain-containing protein [Pseudomonas sp. P8_139]WPN42674.1 DUF6311 domain-containing protein [Pseudomonas sp. P8_229]
MKGLNKHPTLALLPILLGALAFFLVIGPRALDPQNIAWLKDGDPATHYLGWVFFRHSPWTFPLGLNPSYGMELGSSIIFSDSNPLLALLFKPFNGWLPETFQYFGMWLLLCFVLQAWFAWKLLGLITENPLLRLLGAGLLVFSPPMFLRTGGHLSLAGHFLILAALYLALHPALQRRRLAWGVLLAVTALVHAYLLGMVALIWVADLFGKLRADKLTRRQVVIELGSLFALVSVCCWQAGYFSIAGGAVSGGFGFYRMNLLSLVDADGWSFVLADIPTAGGDYEGFNYLGLGVLLLVPLALITWYRNGVSLKALLGRRPLLFWALVGLTLFALSNQIGVGLQTFSYPLPKFVVGLSNIFRASGRMFWPVFYVIVIVLIYLVVRGYRPRIAMGLLALALVVQVTDTRIAWAGLRAAKMVPEASAWASPMHDPFWDSAAAHYKSIRAVTPKNQPDQWQAIADFASIHGLKTDAAYLGRTSPKALDKMQRMTQSQLASGQYDTDSLYILDDDALMLAVKSIHSDTDLLTRVDDFVVLAPGWKHCDQCLAMVDQGRAMSPIPLSQPGLVQTFNRSTRQLAKGWSTPEAWGTWSDGQDAELLLRVSPGTRAIVIDALAFAMPPNLSQRVIVSINGVEAYSTRLTQVQGNRLEIPLSAAQAAEENLTVRLQLPDAISPKKLGFNDDARVMGLGLKTLTVQ